MSIIITSAKLVGKPGTSGWSQAYEYEPQDLEVRKRLGKIFALITTSNQGGVLDTVVGGREILARVHEEYFGGSQESAFERLKTSVEKVLSELSWGEIEIACVVLLNDVTYLAVGGGAKIAILRESQLSVILSSEKGRVTSASGIPKEGDFFIAGTNEFFQKFSPGVVKAACLQRTPEGAVETLAPTLHSLGSGCIGAIFLKIENQIEKIEPVGIQEEKQKEIQFEREDNISKGHFVRKRNFTVLGEVLQKLKERTVFVRKDSDLEKVLSPKKRTMVSIGGILLVLLVISIFFGIRQRQKKIREEKYRETLSQAEHQLAEAEQLYSLNPERARNLFSEAREKVLGISDENYDGEIFTELKRRLEDQEAKILREYRKEPTTFIDLSLLSSGFKADILIASEDKAYVLDREGKRIVSVEIESKRTEVVAGPHQIEEIRSIAVYSGKIYILNSKGLFDLEENKKVIEPDWIGEVLPFAYAGNLYLLEKSASTIWRYAGSDEGFSTKSGWLSSDAKVDLTDAKSLVIDGFIWVLKDDGEILKFSLGNPINFSLKGVVPPLTSPKAIYTNEDSEYFYILDSDNSRVVVVTKEGDYKAQYISDTIKSTKSLIVSEGENKIILLTEDKLLSLDMQHL